MTHETPSCWKVEWEYPRKKDQHVQRPTETFWLLMIAWQHFHIFREMVRNREAQVLQSTGSPEAEHDSGREQLNNNYKLVEEFEFIRTPISPSPLFPGVTSFHCIAHIPLSLSHTHTHTHEHTILFLLYHLDSRLQTWHPFICKATLGYVPQNKSHHTTFQIRKSTFSLHSHPIKRRHSNFANCLNYASFLLWSRAPPYVLYLIVMSAHFSNQKQFLVFPVSHILNSFKGYRLHPWSDDLGVCLTDVLPQHQKQTAHSW